jgi:hypothetical protein
MGYSFFNTVVAGYDGSFLKVFLSLLQSKHDVILHAVRFYYQIMGI